MGNGAEFFVTQYLNGAVVGLQGVVEGQFVFGQAQPFAPCLGLPHLPGQLD